MQLGVGGIGGGKKKRRRGKSDTLLPASVPGPRVVGVNASLASSGVQKEVKGAGAGRSITKTETKPAADDIFAKLLHGL